MKPLRGASVESLFADAGALLDGINVRLMVAANEAVADGTVSLRDYAAVLWQSGEESEEDAEPEPEPVAESRGSSNGEFRWRR